MVRRSPSSGERRPIEQWEVQPIADAVEQWLAQGAPPAPQKHKRTKSTPPAQRPQPQRSHAASSAQNTEQDRPLRKEDVKPLADATERLLAGDSDRLDEKIQALRIEEAILKFAPDFADRLRTETKPHWLTAEQHRLLPHDAPEQQQRRYAIWLYESLAYRLQKAREHGKAFTKEDILDQYGQFQRRDLSEETRRNIAGWEAQNLSVDFTLDNLFAIAQRDLLLGYKMQDENGRMSELYQDSIMLHNLIEDAAGLASVEPASAPAPTDTGTPSTLSGGDITTNS